MYNMNATLYMSEGELIESAGRIRAMIKRLRERGSRTDDLEWDLCYVQRELDLRAGRSEVNRASVALCELSDTNEQTTAAKS